MDCGDSIDVSEYCRELSHMNTEHRSMVERYFVKRYKCGMYALGLV